MINLLNRLSIFFWKNNKAKHLLFFIASVFVISLMGYYFGTFDQAIHIPFLKKFADPTLFPNDKFFDLRNFHYSYFWKIFIPFYKIGFLEISMFIAHFVATYLTFWAIWELSKTLFNNPLSSFLAIIFFCFPHVGFAGFPLFEISLLNRTFILPFLLFSINLYLKNLKIPAFIILGIAYNFHVVSVNFVMAMFLLDSTLSIKKIGIKNFIYQLLAFFIFALPVLIWKTSTPSDNLTINYEWFKIVDQGLLHHILSPITLNPLVSVINIGAWSLILMFFYLNRKLDLKSHLTLDNFIKATVIVLIIQIICQFIPISIIIELQIIRVGLFINLFTYLLLSYFIAQKVERKEVSQVALIMLIIASALSISPLILLIGLIIFNKIKKPIYLKALSVCFIISFIVIASALYKNNIWKPGINIYPIEDDYYKIQLWIKNNTNKNDVFIIPPHIWWFYDLDFKTISERSIVSELSEILEFAFFPKYLPYWKERFNDVAPNTYQAFNGSAFDSIDMTKKAFYSLNEADLVNISRKYQANYLVIEKPYLKNFKLIYENERYVLYKINE